MVRNTLPFFSGQSSANLLIVAAVATASSSGSPSSTSKSPAETLRVGISVAGVAGAFAAVLAL